MRAQSAAKIMMAIMTMMRVGKTASVVVSIKVLNDART